VPTQIFLKLEPGLYPVYYRLIFSTVATKLLVYYILHHVVIQI